MEYGEIYRDSWWQTNQMLCGPVAWILEMRSIPCLLEVAISLYIKKVMDSKKLSVEPWGVRGPGPEAVD